MSRGLALLRFALGELLARRRLPIVAALTALPLWLPSLLAPGSGQDPTVFSFDLFRNLLVPVLLPLVSLTFSTAALGTELRRGTITNLLLKPVPRWAVLATEYLAAVLATLLVLLPSVLVAHVLAARGVGSTVVLEGALVATVVGALAYCALGVLLSLLVSRALLVGLVYALLWEGAVVGVAPSASSLSVRGYVQGVFAAILEGGGGPALNARLGPLSATFLALVVTLLALLLARRRLARMDLP
ncbi:MAG TPA: ABC transporter permease subunit [Actinomycetes bacterium]|jgi:ABC-2 type transport system permease protein|nr:ABC transporter permease subunit [Actinomycetes bacterium]